MTDEEKEAIDYKRGYEVLQLQLHLLREEKDNLIEMQDKRINELEKALETLKEELCNSVSKDEIRKTKENIISRMCGVTNRNTNKYHRYTIAECMCALDILEYFEKEEV